MESNVKHLAFLDGLRGVLALYVLFVHCVGESVAGLGPVLSRFHFLCHYGHAAVGFFIVLSGYSLMLPVATAADRRLRGGFPGYLYRRARRILPPYYAALALSIAVLVVVLAVQPPGATIARASDLSLTSVVAHLFLVHTWVPGQNLTINMALWSVATEWHIYFLFPTLLLPVWRRFGLAALLIVAFALGSAPLLFLPPHSVLLQACPWYIGLFAVGMAGAVLAAAPERSPVWRSLLPSLVCLVCVVAFLHAKAVADRGSTANPALWLFFQDAAIGPVALCLLLYGQRASAAGDARQASLLMQVLESRPATVLGGFSYSLYATHCAVLAAVLCLIAVLRLSPEASFVFRMLVGPPAALGVAYLSSLFFEAPFLKKRPAAPARGEPRPVLRPDAVLTS